MSEVHYPLMFNFKTEVSGNGFIASVSISGGRGLMLQEDGEWWMYGVRPAGLAETGESSQAAFLLFMERLKSVLFDIAAETQNFGEFFVASKRFLDEKIDCEEERWDVAQRALRAAKKISDDAPFLSSLPQEPPENRPTQVVVDLVDHEQRQRLPSPMDNVAYTATARLAA